MKTGMLKVKTATLESKGEPAEGAGEKCLKLLFGDIGAFLAGLVALWLYLAFVGAASLGGTAFSILQPANAAVGIASLLALLFCLIAIPLILPWFVALLTIEFFLPKNSILWKWWILAPAGMVAGVFALWFDGFAYSLLTSGSAFAINVPLLLSTSAAAAILAGATCLTVALTAKWLGVAKASG
jgi:hypothetical protein